MKTIPARASEGTTPNRAARPYTDDLSMQLAEIQRSVATLLDRRLTLMAETLKALADLGIDAHIVRWHLRFPVPEVGTTGVLIETNESRRNHVQREFSLYPGDRAREYGPYALLPDLLQIVHGEYTVLVADGTDMLVAEVLPAVGPTEAAHKRAVARLRTLARSQGMRIRSAEGGIEIIAPSNATVHNGDVASAFKWLMGFYDLELELIGADN